MELPVATLLAFIAVAHAGVSAFEGRIVGGQEGDIKDFPYQASLRIYDQHICGGSIITRNTILTAAHCVHGMENYTFTIRVGSSNNNLGQEHQVVEIRKHQGYSPSNHDNDVAILVVSPALSSSSSVSPISLRTEGVEVPTSVPAVVSGWGVTQEGSQTVPDMLRYVELAMVSTEDCNILLPGKITASMLCTYAVDKDSCQGDSGGPLVSGVELVGVVSWGYGCARPNLPGVYAKVSSLRRWIDANTV